ncbi:MAG: P1 family peptidase [Synergistota bacterium]|nr:P1 family peptidase [Synergistota bacterium]
MVEAEKTSGWLAGHDQDAKGCTGCTVLLFPRGAVASVDVRGGAPGTRETALLEPHCLVEKISAVVLTGGSAWGLAAADGVMRFCGEKGWGFDTGFGVVPIVPSACLFDMTFGEPVSPDADMGYRACVAAAGLEDLPVGPVGAGCGATVGKYAGLEKAVRSGFGWTRVLGDGFEVAALVAVNAFGAVRDGRGGYIAGAASNDGGVIDPLTVISGGAHWNDWGKNTTLAAIVTSARLGKPSCRRVAMMAHDGLADALFPVHTPYDGDTVFCASTGEAEGGVLEVGTLARAALAEAIRSAVDR